MQIDRPVERRVESGLTVVIYIYLSPLGVNLVDVYAVQ
jgi:hypothetical protein